jgi:hypothetical protein
VMRWRCSDGATIAPLSLAVIEYMAAFDFRGRAPKRAPPRSHRSCRAPGAQFVD